MGEISECQLPKMSRWGDSYFDKVENLKFGMLPSYGKTAKNLFTAIKSSRSVLQPSSYHY